MSTSNVLDTVVVGGGPAGLQAGLTLGRLHRAAVVVDSGRYRNAPASHMHNLIGQDGRPPSDLRETARRELRAYATVQLRGATAASMRRTGAGAFETRLDDESVLTSASVILATGVRDRLPEVTGLAEVFGVHAHTCPFCHGHEYAGRVVGVHAGERSGHLVAMLSPIAADVVVLDGLHTVEQVGGRLRVGHDGGEDTVDGLFVVPVPEPAAPFASQLGVEVDATGFALVDAMARTSVPGVYAAGDLAHHRDLPMPAFSVAAAIAAGQAAAAVSIADALMAGDR